MVKLTALVGPTNSPTACLAAGALAGLGFLISLMIIRGESAGIVGTSPLTKASSVRFAMAKNQPMNALRLQSTLTEKKSRSPKSFVG